MRYFLYMTALICSLPAALRWPFFGLCAYLTICFAEPKVLCWQPDIQDSMLVGSCLVIGAVVVGVKRRECAFERNAVTGAVTGLRTWMQRSLIVEPSLLLLPLLLLIAYIGLGWVTTEYPPPRIAAAYSRLCKTVLVTLLMTGLTPDTRRLRTLYAVVALAAGFWAIKGGLKTVTLGPHQVYGADYDNNLFALKSVMALPLIYYLGATVRSPRWRWLLLACCALTCLAILGSRSRSGFLAMIFVLCGIAWTSGRRIRAFLGVGAVAAIAVALSWKDIQTRYESIRDYRHDRSAQGRFHIWPVGWRILSENPLFGVGFENFEREYARREKSQWAAHNIWLQNLVELGLVGHPIWLAMIFGSMGSLAITMWRARRGPPALRSHYYLARGVLLSLCAFFIHGMFHNEEYLDLMFACIGLAAILSIVFEREFRHIRLEAAAGVTHAPTAASNIADRRPVRPPRVASSPIWQRPIPALPVGRHA